MTAKEMKKGRRDGNEEREGERPQNHRKKMK